MLKQKLYSPTLWAVKTKSPCRSLVPSRTTFPPGAVTAKSTSKEPPDWTCAGLLEADIDVSEMQEGLNQSREASCTYRKVESYFGVGLLNIGVEACLLVSLESVRQGRRANEGGQGGQTGEKRKPHDAGIMYLLTESEACQEFRPVGRLEEEVCTVCTQTNYPLHLLSTSSHNGIYYDLREPQKKESHEHEDRERK